MRPVAFGEAFSAGSRLTLFSNDKPDRFFTVPSYQVEDGLPRLSSGSAGPAA
jgi:hypothetical protein